MDLIESGAPLLTGCWPLFLWAFQLTIDFLVGSFVCLCFPKASVLDFNSHTQYPGLNYVCDIVSHLLTNATYNENWNYVKSLGGWKSQDYSWVILTLHRTFFRFQSSSLITNNTCHDRVFTFRQALCGAFYRLYLILTIESSKSSLGLK
jgi:hypothetical protein